MIWRNSKLKAFLSTHRFASAILGLTTLAAPFSDLLADEAISPDSYIYQIEAKDGKNIGSYQFRIEALPSSDGRKLMKIYSSLSIDTSFYLLKVKVDTKEWFIYDQERVVEFDIFEERKLPLSSRKWIRNHGKIKGDSLQVKQFDELGKPIGEKHILLKDFIHVKNMNSRIFSPSKILLKDQVESAMTLDPVSLEIFPIDSIGLGYEIVEFSGRQWKAHRIHRKSKEGEITVWLLSNSLIFKIESKYGDTILRKAPL